jgi:hypothetical protein
MKLLLAPVRCQGARNLTRSGSVDQHCCLTPSSRLSMLLSSSLVSHELCPLLGTSVLMHSHLQLEVEMALYVKSGDMFSFFMYHLHGTYKYRNYRDHRPLCEASERFGKVTWKIAYAIHP